MSTMTTPAAACEDRSVIKGKQLAPLKIRASVQESLITSSPPDTQPLTQLEALWHFECVVSPRSPAASGLLASSTPSSPRSHTPPKSPHCSFHAPARSTISPRATPGSPRSPASHKPSSPPSSPAASSSGGSRSATLSRFASDDMTPKRKVLQRVFSTFDQNGDGSVSIDEITDIFDRLGMPSSEYSIQALLARLVTKSQGHVDEEEFLQLYDTVCTFVEEMDTSASASSVDADVDQDLLAAFHVFDKDGNGYISPTELQSVLCSLGFPQARQLDACVDMIARVDENGDGHVDFFEFKKLFHLENPFMASSIPTF